MLGGTERNDGTHVALDADGGVEVAQATEAAWWSYRWYGWAEWRLTPGIVGLAALVVVLDVVTAWADLTLGHLGQIAISPAFPLALVLASRIGRAPLGVSRLGWHRWREYGAFVGVTLVASIGAYTAGAGGLVEAGGLVVAALGEELVYRLAALIVIGALAAAVVGRDWRHPTRWGTGPGAVALVVSALAFSALPGHVAQMAGVAGITPFASFALVLGWVVLRTGALWPGVAAHAILNLVTISVLATDGSKVLLLGVSGMTLFGIVAAAEIAGRRSGQLRPVPSAIDLTAVST